MKKVLLIEQDAALLEVMTARLWNYMEVIGVQTVAGAELAFAVNPNLDAIIIDGHTDYDGRTTIINLVRMFRMTFNGPILVAYHDTAARDAFMHAGCSHNCLKKDVPKKIMVVLQSHT